MNLLPLTLVYLSFLRLVLSLSPMYMACQLKKSNGESPLEGCPSGTVYVSQTDSSANFTSIQESIDSLPMTGHRVILIGEGMYHETVNVSRTGPLTILGQLDPDTASSRGGNASQRNLVEVWNNRYASQENTLSDQETAILNVAPAWGNDFGNIDFKAYNINFYNRAANYSIGQAVAVAVILANASFYGCVASSYQDTWLTGYQANTYSAGGIIEGETDFLFGLGRAWFEGDTFALLGCGGGIAAWQGSTDTTNGVYISDSSIIRSPDAKPDVNMTQNCYLGRPWNPAAVTVLLNVYMEDVIHVDRFTPWDIGSQIPNTTYFAEFNSHGPGGNVDARVAQDRILGSDEASRHSLSQVFGGYPSWIDYHYQV